MSHHTPSDMPTNDSPPTIRDQLASIGSILRVWAKAIGIFIAAIIVWGIAMNVIRPYIAEGTFTTLFIASLLALCGVYVMYARSLGLGG